MKIAQLFLASFVLLGIIRDAFSTNPDSAIVQDSSEDNEVNKPRPTSVRNSDSQPVGRSVGDTSRYNGVSIVRVLKPTISGSRIIWREVGVSEGMDIMRNRTPFFTVWTNMRSRRPTSNNPVGSRNPNNGVRRRPSNRDRSPNRQNNSPPLSGEEFDGNTPDVSSNNNGNEQIFPGINYSSQNNRNDGRLPIIFVEEVSPSTVLSDPPVRGTFAFSLPKNEGNDQYSPDKQLPNGQIDSYDNGERQSNEAKNRNIPIRRSGNVPNNRDFRVKGERNPPVFQTSQPPLDIPSPNIPGSTATKPNRKSSADSSLFATIVNNFAFKLINQMNLEENFVMSPLSLFVALSMGYLGSDGNTKTQLEQVLGMDENEVHEEHLHQGIKDLITLIEPASSENEFSVANGMFLGKNFTPEVKFLDDMQNYYNAEVHNLDFRDPKTVQDINNWVAQNTRNMITNLLDSTPSPRTRLLLLNAVFFKGKWKTQFHVNETFSGTFHTLDGNSKMVQTMSLSDKLKVFRSDEHRHTFIKLPYEGEDISMIIALPYSETEAPMSPETDQILCVVQDSMVDTEVDFFSIPKFRLEHGTSLKEPLEQLGILDLFDSFSADLSKLRKNRDVYVSEIFQKALIDVNEEGTTASAATGMRLVPLTLNGERRIQVDHPFTFFIVHNPTGLIKFYGKVFDPDLTQSIQGEIPRRRQRPRQNSEIRRNRNR